MRVFNHGKVFVRVIGYRAPDTLELLSRRHVTIPRPRKSRPVRSLRTSREHLWGYALPGFKTCGDVGFVGGLVIAEANVL